MFGSILTFDSTVPLPFDLSRTESKVNRKRTKKTNLTNENGNQSRQIDTNKTEQNAQPKKSVFQP